MPIALFLLCGILDASGLCVNAGRKQTRFAVNEFSACQLKLNYDSFTNCTTLRFDAILDVDVRYVHKS